MNESARKICGVISKKNTLASPNFEIKTLGLPSKHETLGQQ